MKISLVQFNPVWELKNANMVKLTSMLEKKSALGDLVIFPEMTLTGFTMNATKMFEDKNSESLKFFSRFSKSKNIHVLAGIIEKNKNNYFNSLVHFSSNGKLQQTYRKIHPFSFSDEDKYYKKGNNIVITKIKEWRIGLSICYDLRFPELFRLYAKKNVELIVNIANWPINRIEHWRTLLKARAIENQCYVIGVNRVGKDLKLNYNGNSSVFDPMGKEILAAANKEAIFSTEIDLDYVKEIRERLPFLRDMRLV
ncbi:MAG: carbon-nitrogen family hydrolase [Ignavibacteriaceae bacterium]|nr:carbon-nitrogen family hydrolase [Ignavibacteriaceae bacterium]